VRVDEGVYERLYEAHARAYSDGRAVGDEESFDLIGRMELSLLVAEGLEKKATIVDFGCGIGRLAVHLVPWLEGGHYTGIDISDTMLVRARERIARAVPAPTCRVSWHKQTDPRFPPGVENADVIVAFSVFTHMEHEDAYAYLKSALGVVRPGGRFLFSCLPLKTKLGRTVFLDMAKDSVSVRWSRIRSVATSADFMASIAELAGWKVLRWYDGDEENIPVDGKRHALGQSTCVLERP
jgi:SAM-dependent methyltransferase